MIVWQLRRRARSSLTIRSARLATPALAPTISSVEKTSFRLIGSRLMTTGEPGSEHAAAVTFLRLDTGADVAQRLGHDQIGFQFLQHGQVERVKSPPGFKRSRTSRSISPLDASCGINVCVTFGKSRTNGGKSHS